jgi:preprotein translocase subunit SecG
VLATLFFVTSLALAYLATQQTAPRSLLEATPAPQSIQPAPVPQAPPDDSGLPQLPAQDPPAPPANEQN